MRALRTVLVVSPTSLAETLALSVRQSGYHPIVARGFAEAKKYLDAAPHLIVTELKLGGYNGLHLAVRASGSRIPAIVIADQSFEGEVEALGSVWMSPDAAKDELAAVMVQLLQYATPPETAAEWHDGGDAALPRWEPPRLPLLH